MNLPRKLLTCLLTIISIVLLTHSEAMSKTEHVVYFEGTDYELHVYRIYGKEPGKTLLIIGGIQGDESGGYMTADLYADMSLKKGNLIVVPRANFLSIIKHKRAINSDMNRRFNIDSKEYYEDNVVEILKGLIDQSDFLLNLHEGSGFYSERYESDLVNPKRFGQSVIADTDVFSTKDGRVLNLAYIAKDVIKRVNLRIKDKNHLFKFNNHRTFEKDTIHPEQRKSATFYALSTRNIPAFGIEASKEIQDLEKKMRYQSIVINAFMERFDIVPETPGIELETPRLSYLVVSVNDKEYLLHNTNVLKVRRGDRVKITGIVANYKRGLTVDVIGVGSSNDLNRVFVVESALKAVVMKDGYKCGEAGFALTDDLAVKNDQVHSFKYLIVESNGIRQVLKDAEHFKTIRGDVVRLIDVVTDGYRADDLSVNLVDPAGAAGAKTSTPGKGRDFLINTLKIKPSNNKTGSSCSIEVSSGKDIIGTVYLDIEEPKMDYLVLRQNKGGKRWYTNGDLISISASDVLEIVDVKTNINGNAGVKVNLTGNTKNNEKTIMPGDSIKGSDLQHKTATGYQIVITRDGIVLGKAVVQVVESLVSKY
ncbi:MAG: succinylglutamate desuccinylase/aspartoacylase family protein [Nitrospirae bacterium]|nr:succinylglutamate desuccinylase/aspartoacylase family protein [Nitrospirota bacterium]MBF0591112.1 succinylglutamate desuccinylase/aspartoacylase family protein [Nitrospirota bacterium]